MIEDWQFVTKKNQLGVARSVILDHEYDTTLRLSALGGPLRVVAWMARHTFTDRNGNPNVFNLKRNEDGLWLNNNWANPDNKWNLDNKFVFRLSKCFFSAP